MPSAAVEVDGLRELRRDLKRAGAQFPKELRAVNLKTAEVVAAEVRRLAPKGPHQGGGTVRPIVASVRALASQSRAQVAVGGARTPHAAVHNYGGTIPRFNSTARTTILPYPYIEPAIDAKTDEVLAVYDEALDRLLRRAFPGR
jgi:hypothetical protein